MNTSKLKYEIDTLRLKHEYDLKILKMQQEIELQQLINKCNHKWDNGSSAITWKGMQHNGYEFCQICGKTI